jgi:hypothetical protein
VAVAARVVKREANTKRRSSTYRQQYSCMAHSSISVQHEHGQQQNTVGRSRKCSSDSRIASSESCFRDANAEGGIAMDFHWRFDSQLNSRINTRKKRPDKMWIPRDQNHYWHHPQRALARLTVNCLFKTSIQTHNF